MYLVPSFNRATAKPARPDDVSTPGWFQVHTEVDYGTMNMLIDECSTVATLKGAALDRDNDHQMADVLEGVVKAVEGKNVETLNVDTVWSLAVIASTDATVGEDDGGVVHCLVAASDNSAAKGYESAVIAARNSRAGTIGGSTFTAAVVASTLMAAEGDDSLVAASECTDSTPAKAAGDQSFIAACSYTTATLGVSGSESAALAGTDQNVTGNRSMSAASGGSVVSGNNSAAVGGGLNTVSGNNSAAVGSAAAVTSGEMSATLASQGSEATQTRTSVISSYLSRNNSNAHSVCMASRYCDAAASTVPPEGSVFGGWDAGTTYVEPSWRLESNGGHVRGAGTVASGGLDYAEWYDNTDKVAHPVARLVTYGPEWDGCRLATEGQEVLGVVSIHPSVLGGDDSFAWTDKWLRNVHGQLVFEDAVVSDVVRTDPAAWVTRDQRERREMRRLDREVQTRKKELSRMVAQVELESVRLNQDLRQIRSLRRKTEVVTSYETSLANQMSAHDQANKPLIAAAKAAVDAAVVARSNAVIDISDLDLSEQRIERTVKVRVLNPTFDAMRAHVPRDQRPDEKTKVGTMGQMLVDVTQDTKPGDWIVPWKDGIGQGADKPLGRPVRCMKITVEYDAERGYAVAKCQVG